MPGAYWPRWKPDLENEIVPVIDQTVRRIRSKGGAVSGVELQDGSIIEADVIVIAAGARSEELVADGELVRVTWR